MIVVGGETSLRSTRSMGQQPKQRPGPVVDVVELNGEPGKGPRIPPACGKQVVRAPTSIEHWTAGAQAAGISALPSEPGQICSLAPEAGTCRQQKFGKWQCFLDFPGIGLFERLAFFAGRIGH